MKKSAKVQQQSTITTQLGTGNLIDCNSDQFQEWLRLQPKEKQDEVRKGLKESRRINELFQKTGQLMPGFVAQSSPVPGFDKLHLIVESLSLHASDPNKYREIKILLVDKNKPLGAELFHLVLKSDSPISVFDQGSLQKKKEGRKKKFNKVK